MKVLFVFNHPAPYKVRLFNELSKEIDLHVIFERNKASDRPDDFYNCHNYQFKYTFLKKGSFSRENSNTNELKKYIKKHHQEYDLIIMNGYSTITEMKTIRYMKKHHIEFVLYINGGVIKKENIFKKKLKQSLILSAKKYLSPCEEASEYLIHYGVKKDDIYHYPYSTLYEKELLKEVLSAEEKQIIRDKYHLPSSPLFITASSFIERKNILQLIQCFKDMPTNLLIIGEGPLKESYISYIKENKLNNIFLRDFEKRDVLFEILKGGDYFITLSNEDIYGHTTNEAMANGLPVVSSNKVVSSKHLIKNGINGYLVDLQDISKIKEAILKMNKEMTKEAIKTASFYTFEKSKTCHIKIFKEIVK